MKRVNDREITPQQLKALQTTFSRLGWNAEERHGFVREFTNGRTESAKELTLGEARFILSRMNGEPDEKQQQEQRKKDQDEARKLVGAIYFLSRSISFLNANFDEYDEAERRMNYAKINMFCRTKSKFRKNLTEMNLTELRAIKKQFEAIAKKEKEATHAGHTENAGT